MTHETDCLFVDVDTGIDDAFALLYACAEPQARLVGVSTVVGNVSLANATRNTRAVLALAGRADIPVCARRRGRRSRRSRGMRERSTARPGSATRACPTRPSPPTPPTRSMR